MRRMSRKIIAVLLVAIMLMAMSVTAFAKDRTTYTVTFYINQTNGQSSTQLAGPVQVNVNSGATLYQAVNQLTAYQPQFVDVYDEDDEYQYSYLNSMKVGSTTYASTGSSTPSTPGDWTHGHYEGWDWEYYVNSVYGSTYMTSYYITSNITVDLNYAYNSFNW